MNFVKIVKSKKTVFRINDFKNIFNTQNEQVIRNYLNRAHKKDLLEKIYYGIWKLTDRKVNFWELATKIKSKSYVSLETVLQQEGIIFQDSSDTISCVSDNTLNKEAYWKKFVYNKIKDQILLNPLGVNYQNNAIVASKERAICDRLYLTKWYYFDNLQEVNFDKLEDISQIYNKRVISEVKKLVKNAQE